MTDIDQLVTLVKFMCYIPVDIHAHANHILTSAAKGIISINEFQRWFHMTDSSLLEYTDCVVDLLFTKEDMEGGTK